MNNSFIRSDKTFDTVLKNMEGFTILHGFLDCIEKKIEAFEDKSSKKTYLAFDEGARKKLNENLTMEIMQSLLNQYVGLYRLSDDTRSLIVCRLVGNFSQSLLSEVIVQARVNLNKDRLNNKNISVGKSAFKDYLQALPNKASRFNLRNNFFFPFTSCPAKCQESSRHTSKFTEIKQLLERGIKDGPLGYKASLSELKDQFQVFPNEDLKEIKFKYLNVNDPHIAELQLLRYTTSEVLDVLEFAGNLYRKELGADYLPGIHEWQIFYTIYHLYNEFGINIEYQAIYNAKPQVGMTAIDQIIRNSPAITNSVDGLLEDENLEKEEIKQYRSIKEAANMMEAATRVILNRQVALLTAEFELRKSEVKSFINCIWL